MNQITIEALISSDINTVWEKYTQPEHITQWNFADPSWHCPSASNDMRIGGQYSARMEARDGSFGFDFEAIYEQVKINDHFVYRIPDGREVRVRFEESGSTARVEISFDPEKVNPIELQRNGWQAILNNFKKYVELVNE